MFDLKNDILNLSFYLLKEREDIPNMFLIILDFYKIALMCI